MLSISVRAAISNIPQRDDAALAQEIADARRAITQLEVEACRVTAAQYECRAVERKRIDIVLTGGRQRQQHAWFTVITTQHCALHPSGEGDCCCYYARHRVVLSRPKQLGNFFPYCHLVECPHRSHGDIARHVMHAIKIVQAIVVKGTHGIFTIAENGMNLFSKSQSSCFLIQTIVRIVTVVIDFPRTLLLSLWLFRWHSAHCDRMASCSAAKPSSMCARVQSQMIDGAIRNRCRH